jgi:hypothetical protein
MLNVHQSFPNTTINRPGEASAKVYPEIAYFRALHWSYSVAAARAAFFRKIAITASINYVIF